MSERTQPVTSAAALAAATILSASFVAAVLFDLAPWLRGPAPYPPEWQWEYRQPLAPLPLGATALVALLLLLLAASGLPALRRHERAAARTLVLAAVVLGLALPLALLAREPAGALRTLLARTTSFSTTSYHTAALSEEARDPLAFVRRHAELLPELARTAKHAATHPVGPVLFFRAAVAACERWPALTDALLGLAGVPDRDFSGPLTRPARAGALVGALGLGLLAALTAWPLAALAEALGCTPLAAARVALLWAALPGPALIAPRFDAAIALPIVAGAWLLFEAVRGPRLVVRAALAGGCGGLAMSLTYGAAAFLALAGLASGVAALVCPGASRREPGPSRSAGLAVALLVSAGVSLALAFGLPAIAGGHPIDAMRTALAIHRESYTAGRSYLLWLLFDPIDFAALLGVPVACLAAATAASAARDLLRQRPVAPHAVFGLVALAGMAALVASGVARGEVGRLWIPLMPLVLVAGAAGLDQQRAAPATLVGFLAALSTLAIAAAWRL